MAPAAPASGLLEKLGGPGGPALEGGSGTARGVGAGRAAVSQFLWYELQDHVGLDPERAGTDCFADRLVAWSAHW